MELYYSSDGIGIFNAGMADMHFALIERRFLLLLLLR